MFNTDPKLIRDIFEAQRAFFTSQKTKNIKFRQQNLINLKKWIKYHESDIAAALKKDLGKDSIESYFTEIGLVLSELSLHIRKIRKWAKKRMVAPAMNNFPARSYIQPEPYGTVLNISPWNYPFLMTTQPLVGIISAGNTAVIKPSEMAPATAEIVGKMCEELFPHDYVTVIQGAKETAAELLKLPFDYVFFTGSTRVGKIVMKAAAENLTPVTLELGGKSPVIVHHDANLKTAARRIAWGKTVNAGQTCVAPDYLLVHKNVKNELIEKIRNALKQFYGDNMEDSHYPNIVDSNHFDRLCHLMQDQKILFGGRNNKETRCIEPTLLDEPSSDSPLMQEEIFGPLLPVIAYEDIEQVISFISARPKPLALYLFSSSAKIRKRINQHLSSGALTVNDTLMHLGNHRLPFGGVGKSGMGSYHGKCSFDTFSHCKALMINSSKPDIPVRYAPYNKIKESVLKTFLR